MTEEISEWQAAHERRGTKDFDLQKGKKRTVAVPERQGNSGGTVNLLTKSHGEKKKITQSAKERGKKF